MPLDDALPFLVPATRIPVPHGGLAIGDAAAAFGLSVDTLRYYEREGLMLEPADRSAGKRRYFERDLSWLGGLVMLRATGMTIADLREFAKLSRRAGTEPERLHAFEEHRRRVVADIDRLRGHLAAIDVKIEGYRRALDESPAPRQEKSTA